ncbi:MAG: YciI family protein [Alphaproteobacteria bacterium]|nr:YciI family protein [Alphaproteobacteria bacterium]MBV9371228.1 YciI family protein [Alphaproteobacteria bacterium]MBV9902833.1 YciI family protein [Alphaproteobacteria bacterium]
MTFVVIGRDVPGGAARRRCRAAHLAFVAGRQAGIVYAGPLIEEGEMIGSLFVFDLPDRAALDAYLAEDPYFTTPIFSSVEIYESRWMVPEQSPGLLAAEAERAAVEASGR